MVEACQVENSMQRQDLHFLSHRVPETPSILHRNVGGNGDLTNESGRLAGSYWNRERWKRQHVGRLILTAKPAIQRAHGRTTRYQNIHCTVHPDRTPRLQHKAFERLRAQSWNFLVQNNHFPCSIH